MNIYFFRVLQLFLLGILKNGVIFPWKSPVKENPQRFTSPTKTVFLFKQFSRLEFWGKPAPHDGPENTLENACFFWRGKTNSTFGVKFSPQLAIYFRPFIGALTPCITRDPPFQTSKHRNWRSPAWTPQSKHIINTSHLRRYGCPKSHILEYPKPLPNYSGKF